MSQKKLQDNVLVKMKAAHKLSFKNAEVIKASNLCGCFHCMEIYDPAIITALDYKTESDGACTVFCPKCGIDAVISCSDAGDSLSTEFLTEMNQYYFGF